MAIRLSKKVKSYIVCIMYKINQTMKYFIPRLAFFVMAIFFMASCDRDRGFDAILNEGPAPSELQANIVFNNDEPPFSVTISPTAEGATAFEVLSGIPGEAAVLIGIQESVTFEYPEAEENFFVTIRAIAPNGKVTEEQFEIEPPADPCTQIFSAPVSWDNGNDPSFFFGFNGVELEVVENPDPSGANPEVSNVLQITQDGGGNFDGFGVQMTGPALFSAADKVVRLNFWSDVALPVRLTVQQDPNNTTEREAEVNLEHGGTGWEELRFDFATAIAGFTGSPDGALGIVDGASFVPTGEYIRFQMFISPGDDVAGTFFLDNVGICPDGGAAPPEEPEDPVDTDSCTSIFDTPITLENGEEFFGFNGVDVQIVANPDQSGANPNETNVLEIVQDGGGNFDGFGTVLENPVDFSGDDKVVRALVWSNSAVTFRLNMQQNPTNNETEREVEVAAAHGGTGWEELRFDFANAVAGFANEGEALGIANGEAFVPTGQYNQPTFFIAPGEDVSGTFYLDNLGACPGDDTSSSDDMMDEEEEEDMESCASIFDTPITLENGEEFFGFNGVDVQIVANPDQSGANPNETNVLEVVQDGGGNFDGFGTVLATPADFSGDDKVVRVLFWSNSAVTVRLNMQQNPNNNETEREVEVAVAHGGTGWEELRFDFANAVAGFVNEGEALGIANGEAFAPTGQYNQPTFFIGPGEDVSGTFYIDNLGACPGDDTSSSDDMMDEEEEMDPCASIFGSPVTLENGESFFGFNGVDVQVVANPDQSGANPNETNVLEVVQDGGGNFDGFGTVLATPADFSGDDKVVRVLFWSNSAVTVRLNMQQNPNNNETEREVEVAVAHGGTGWEELRFDFANAVAGFVNEGEALGIANGEAFAPTGQYNQPTFFIGPGEDVSGTFYIDNLGSCPE